MFEGTTLFIGALLDAVIGPNLLVPGEPFMLAAGYQLHQGIWSGVIAVLLGGFIGDQISFFIGHQVGAPVQKKLIRCVPKTRRAFARCRRLMYKKGNAILVFARLLGPIAWVVPFMAGSNRITWPRFTLFSLIGLLLGVGQFVLWGYLAAYGLETLSILQDVQIFIAEHKYSILVLLLFIGTLYFGYKRKWRFLAIKSFSILSAALLFTNYSHFFWFSDDLSLSDKIIEPPEKIELTKFDYKAYPGKSSYFNAQAINIVYIGSSPKSMMLSLGWIENKTFSRNEIEWTDYLELLKAQTPPVSDLFWQGSPQLMAFQLPGDLMKRNHIRWWLAGIDSKTNQTIWVGAASYDNGLKITPYSGIITVLHKIEPNVDQERDAIAMRIRQVSERWGADYIKPIAATVLDEKHDYYSDGRVVIITDKSSNTNS
ncbi:LssY C-terminal domain-containing protein [Vibrio sp. DW001]|uniref:LssY C-terminal domain-containing protein n=1 Tax=Vibrio sp. DW001 TaxID=2912315 RepID=UPI0023B07DFA|nr:LssY C-terminal domain-containing protein [Vibrio sp. DW001]WED26228.1 LssY C-terminal domain-containing protein [Vibrio sp. DW001]